MIPEKSVSADASVDPSSTSGGTDESSDVSRTDGGSDSMSVFESTSPPGIAPAEAAPRTAAADTSVAGQPDAHVVTDADTSVPADETSRSTTNGPVTPADNVVPPPAEEASRRVRLNPTVTPEMARPVPSIKGSAVPASPIAREAASTTPPVPQREGAGEESTEQSGHVSAATPGAEVSEPEVPVVPVDPVAIPSADTLDSDLEAALEAALASDTAAIDVSPVEESDDTSAEEGEASAQPRGVKKGARLQGTVQSIHGDDMFIELGHRLPGVLSRRQFGLKKQPMQGEPIEVVITRIDEREGLIHCNLPRGASKPSGNWDEVTTGQTVECMVNRTNKGGLEVSIGSLRGFMPASQVEMGFVADLEGYVGQKLRARVMEVNPKRRKLVVSRRSLMEEERSQSEQEMFQKLAPGQQYTGHVKTIKDYGAFVDIGGIDGLVHVAQISWNRINHPSEMLTEGQEVQVQVLSVDPEKKKVSLGMRQLMQNPWAHAEQKFASGSVLKGKVTRTEAFGAFVELENGVEGLVHISELDHKRVNRVTEVLSVGQETEVKVLEVDPKKKRISLSIKALKEAPEEATAPEEAAPVTRRSRESLKGGIGEPTRGQLFGDPRQFG